MAWDFCSNLSLCFGRRFDKGHGKEFVCLVMKKGILSDFISLVEFFFENAYGIE